MASVLRVLLLNGPNLNMLGQREPQIYGAATLEQIVGELRQHASTLNVELTHLQSNAEHELVTAIQQALGQQDFILIHDSRLPAGPQRPPTTIIKPAATGLASLFQLQPRPQGDWPAVPGLWLHLLFHWWCPRRHDPHAGLVSAGEGGSSQAVDLSEPKPDVGFSCWRFHPL